MEEQEQKQSETEEQKEKTFGEEVLEAVNELLGESFQKDVIGFFDGNKKASGKRVRKALLDFGKLSKEIKQAISEKRAEMAEAAQAAKEAKS